MQKTYRVLSKTPGMTRVREVLWRKFGEQSVEYAHHSWHPCYGLRFERQRLSASPCNHSKRSGYGDSKACTVSVWRWSHLTTSAALVLVALVYWCAFCAPPEATWKRSVTPLTTPPMSLLSKEVKVDNSPFAAPSFTSGSLSLPSVEYCVIKIKNREQQNVVNLVAGTYCVWEI